MSDSIRISPKHGVNPCIPICVFCGEQKNEIALLGMLKDDAEAPHSAIIDYQPCEKCLKNWALGVAIIKVTEKQPVSGMEPLSTIEGVPVYPTGQYHVITTDAAKRIFDIDAKPGTPALVAEEVFDKFTENAKESGALKEEGKIQNEND